MEWWVKEYGPIDKRHMVLGNINLARFRFFSPIFQRSIVPTFQHVCRRFVLHPYGVKSKPGPVGQDSLLLHGPNPQGEFFKLCRRRLARGFGKEAGRLLGFWKGYHITDGGLFGHKHN